MNIGLYQSAASLSALERWQDAVAQNITSAQTNGFRKRTVEFSSETAGKWNVDSTGQGKSGDEVQALFTRTTNGINFITGETEPTGRDLDVAIQGQGFFQVKQPDGTMAYTRNGEFRVRPDRTLVTAGNCEVMTDSGSPITLTPDGGNLTINQDGTLAQGSTVLGKLAVQKFANPDALMPSAGGLFSAGAGAGMTPVDKPELMQGYLEQSNVQPLREMVDLVLISRAYEANQKIISTTDDQMQKTLDALG
ncbi:MAG TPA: flagellar hook-basal body protein [Candidatus Didemnitutus sp.]|nr:flagellar hook-basal body protein [Candidatus Didemnitutus sp.]